MLAHALVEILFFVKWSTCLGLRYYQALVGTLAARRLPIGFLYFYQHQRQRQRYIERQRCASVNINVGMAGARLEAELSALIH